MALARSTSSFCAARECFSRRAKTRGPFNADTVRGGWRGSRNKRRLARAVAFLGLALIGTGVEAGAATNFFAFERMGAGVPAGWNVRRHNCEWSAEPAAGPFGPGAARVRFTGQGALKLESPVCFMQPGLDHRLQVWARSEPPGARLKIVVRDNGFFPTGSQGAVFSGECRAGSQWQPLVVEGSPPAAGGTHFYVELEAGGENQTVWLDGLAAGVKPAPISEAAPWLKIHPAGVALKPEAAWGLVTGEEPLRVEATVVGATQPGASLRLRAVHSSGIAEDLPPVRLNEQPVWKGTLEPKCRAARLFGMMRLEARVVDAAGDALSAMSETLLARAPAPVPGPLSASPFGIHVSFREPDLSVAAKLGYKWCRVHDASGATKWGLLEKEPGRWSWQDEAIALPGRHGLSILGMLDSAPPWASGITNEGYWSIYGAPRNLEDWRRYVRTVVARYAGVIDRWEVWNEPWLNAGNFRFFQNGGPETYGTLLKAAFEEAKAVNPRVKIVGINTFPPAWDQAVLAAGAYPFFDALSFHRYDHSLHGRPGDALALEAARLRKVQERYGPPKPLELTEGGPDVSLFQGSFFSFADRRVVGDWDRGADQYARMFLGAIAAGIERFTAYSIHNAPRHGDPTHMMVEPGPLLRPLHLTVSALAQFVEGARYEGSLTPGDDITAHAFRQPASRYFAPGPSLVVALVANGEDPEPLPHPLPPETRCFDRWGNPATLPQAATRGITYLVATGDGDGALRHALEPETDPPPYEPGAEGLVRAVAKALDEGNPPLWTLFSSLGSLAVLESDGTALHTTRHALRRDPQTARRFRIPGAKPAGPPKIKRAGASANGWVQLQSDTRQWLLSFAAVPDGRAGRWRLTLLTLVAGGADEQTVPPDDARAVLQRWERGVGNSDILRLRDTLADPAFCAVASMPNPQVIANRDYFITWLHGLLSSGMKKSPILLERTAGNNAVITTVGDWEVESAFMGPMRLALTATLARQDGAWRLVSLSLGPLE